MDKKRHRLAAAVIIIWLGYFTSAMILGFESWIVKALSLLFIISWGILIFKGWKTREKNNELF
ncbi:hypothetical protein [Sporosarcina aquimarina]|uniref:Uncharacterized protein n=1 Tax=Sporosarcina aquimarina TaxID=114975 RepID=A0ABU4FZZ4_9BACL|nr:hypothetical protein [Sporosarcina aquimarina]MDW0109697.1 hypothetical protein [Sporosarcina aquimarina]